METPSEIAGLGEKALSTSKLREWEILYVDTNDLPECQSVLHPAKRLSVRFLRQGDGEHRRLSPLVAFCFVARSRWRRELVIDYGPALGSRPKSFV